MPTQSKHEKRSRKLFSGEFLKIFRTAFLETPSGYYLDIHKILYALFTISHDYFFASKIRLYFQIL